MKATTLANWYFCSGCGASVRCNVCGATECSQDINPAKCKGCAKALAMSAETAPWNMSVPPTKVTTIGHDEGRHERIVKYPRPVRHIRKRETRLEIFHKKDPIYQDQRAPRRLYGKPNRRPRRVKYIRHIIGELT